MMAGQPIPFDGSSDVMIVHRDDVVQAIKLAIDKGFSGLFNLFNEVTCSKAEFFAKVCDENGYDHVQWLNLSPGPKNVSNEKIKSHGLDFLDPDATRDAENLLD
jgi:nucleoside-diphosphate-sugar epimerase